MEILEFVNKLYIDQCIENISKSVEILSSLVCLRILTRDDSARKYMINNGVVQILYPITKLEICQVEDNILQINQESTVEALKCLCNIVFKNPEVIPKLRMLNMTPHLLNRIKSYNSLAYDYSIKLFDLKLIFIYTARQDEISLDILENENFFEVFSEFLDRYALNPPLQDLEFELIIEFLKFSYNILMILDKNTEKYQESFNISIKKIQIIIDSKPSNMENYMEIIRHIINLLSLFPTSCYSMLVRKNFEKTCDKKILFDRTAFKTINRFLKFFDYMDSKLECNQALSKRDHLYPIMALLVSFIQSSESIRHYLKIKILPPLGDDVRKLPHEGNTLRNRLCKYLTSSTSELAESSAMIIYLLCNKNVNKAIKYTGFGNFAGFLSRHGLMNFSSNDQTISDDESETEEYLKLCETINPVTGRWEPDFLKKQQEIFDGMSEEQKEYEAMKLVEKIDRLQRHGFIQPGTVDDSGHVKPVSHILELINNVPEKCIQESVKDNSD